MARKKVAKCACGCGQAPAVSCRMRKISCSCGESIAYMSRKALASVDATCIACGFPMSPDCLYDRVVSHDEDDATRAYETLSQRAHDSGVRRARDEIGPSYRETGSRYRCGDCQAIRAAHGSCTNCRSDRPPTTSYMHPRAARVAGGDMPF